MELPHAELLAPVRPVAERVADVGARADTAAVFGRASDLADLARRPALRHLWISGLRPRDAAIVGALRGLETLVVHDLRAPSLAELGGLAALRALRVAGSSKLASLAGLERLTGLAELVLFDCCGYASVAELGALSALETLCLEGGFSKELRLDTLAPLAGLSRLRRLRLASLRVADGSLRPLHGLSALREVFVARAFADEELRAAAAALPAARGQHLDAFRAGAER